MENPLGDLRRLLAAGKPDEAERVLRARAPRSRAPKLQLARLANEHQQWALSEKLARELVAEDGNDSEAWSALGFSAFSQGRHREARASLERALALNPSYAAARRNLASVLAEQELSEEALEQLQRLGPLAPPQERTRARALIQLDRFEEAEQILLRLVEATPGDGASHDLLLRLRQLRGDEDPARSLRAAAGMQGAQASLRLKLADAMRRLGDNAGAENALRVLIQEMGPTPSLLSAVAAVLQDSGRMAEALALARQARASDNANIDIAETFVATAIAGGAEREALPVVEQLRAAYPRDQRWITHRLDIARLLGEKDFESWWDPARVTRHFDLAVSLEPLREEIGALHRQGNHPIDQSLRQGTQTSRNLLVRPGEHTSKLLGAFSEAMEQFRVEVIDVSPRSGPAGAHPLVARNSGPAAIVGCWSVKLRRGGFHVGHIHPEGWLSSAFYLLAPAEADDVTQRAGWLKFGEPRYPVAGLDATGYVQPKPGRLVLFPSYLWHGTTALAGEEPRMSVAFDAVPEPEIR